MVATCQDIAAKDPPRLLDGAILQPRPYEASSGKQRFLRAIMGNLGPC